MSDNQHDITKRMLQVMRENKIPTASKNLEFLLEFNGESPLGNTEYQTAADSEGGMHDDPNMPDAEAVEPLPEDMAQMESMFGDVVYGKFNFTDFKIYPQTNDAVLEGNIPDMGNLTFKMSVQGTDSLKVSATDLQLTSNNADVIKKLYNFYARWVGDWDGKIKQDYKGGR